jgi:hypothetical protein
LGITWETEDWFLGAEIARDYNDGRHDLRCLLPVNKKYQAGQEAAYQEHLRGIEAVGQRDAVGLESNLMAFAARFVGFLAENAAFAVHSFALITHA